MVASYFIRNMVSRFVRKESYFATCEHDPKTGGCLPKGEGQGASGSDKSGFSDVYVPKRELSYYGSTTGGVSQEAHCFITDWQDRPTAMPSKSVVLELSKYVPDKAVTLYRGGKPGSKGGLKSWTYDKSVAEGFVEEGEKVIKRKWYPDEVLLDFTKLPKEYRDSLEENGMGNSLNEVVVAYGDILKDLKAVRGSGKAPKKESHLAGVQAKSYVRKDKESYFTRCEHDPHTGYCLPEGGSGGESVSETSGPKDELPLAADGAAAGRVSKLLGDRIGSSKGLEKGQADKFQRATHAALSAMPDKVQARIAENVKDAEFFKDSVDLAQEGLAKRDWFSKLEKFLGTGPIAVNGAYSTKQQKLYLTEGILVSSQEFAPHRGWEAGTTHSFAHEMMHAVDGPNEEHSSSKEWQAAWREEIGEETKKQKPPVTLSKYAQTHPAEGFAEFGRAVYVGGKPFKEVEAKFPKCAALWRKWGYAPNESVDKSLSVEMPALPEIFTRRIDTPEGALDAVETQEPQESTKGFSKSFVRKGESYFATCEHDPHTGGCLPKNGAGSQASGESAPKKPQASYKSTFHAVKRNFDKDDPNDDGSYSGAPKEVVQRAKALKLPPAWKNVMVSPDPKSSLQAVGVDIKGREQRVYSAEHSTQASAEKFLRVKALVAELPRIDAKLQATLQGPDGPEKEAAACLLLMRKTGFRIGSDTDTKAEKKAEGASTLRGRHVTKMKDGSLRFFFIGKKGVRINQRVADPGLVQALSQRIKGPGDRLFDTDPAKVRDYLHTIDGPFHPKDLRTIVAAETALAAISNAKPPKDDKFFVKSVKEVAKQVSAKLGNTPTVALKSYIPPEVFGVWNYSLDLLKPKPRKPRKVFVGTVEKARKKESYFSRCEHDPKTGGCLPESGSRSASPGGVWTSHGVVGRRTIASVGDSNGWDVCQMGVEVAEKFSDGEAEYNDIWTAFQDVFDLDKDGVPGGYNVRPDRRDAYIGKIQAYLKAGEHIGKGEDSEEVGK